MSEYVEEEDQWAHCTCCGKALYAHENMVKDEVPYPYDRGFGICKGCNGDPEGKTLKGRLGWSYCMFMEARFPVVRDSLSTTAKIDKWNSLSYIGKCKIVQGAIEKGLMI